MDNTDLPNYILMDPTGNITALVTEEVPAERMAKAAAVILEKEPAAEQLGFLKAAEDADIELYMAGGEFCGNAAMCAAVYYAESAGISGGDILVRVSGAKDPVAVSVCKTEETDPSGSNGGSRSGNNAGNVEDCYEGVGVSCGAGTAFAGASDSDADIHRKLSGSWECSVLMPEPESIRNVVFSDGCEYPVVHFPGADHIICVTGDRNKMPGCDLAGAERADNAVEDTAADAESVADVHGLAAARAVGSEDAVKLAEQKNSAFDIDLQLKAKLEDSIKKYCRELGSLCCGLMIYDRENSVLDPLVYVPGADTLFWEHSCASGTTSLGAWMMENSCTPFEAVIHEPGGDLVVSASADRKLRLTGHVK